MRGYVGRKNLRPWRAAGVVLAVSGAVVAGVVSVPGQAANAAAGTPDLTAAVQYLVTSTNNVDNGPTLANDGYYDLYPGWADWGMTIDGAFALAATRGDDTVLKKVVIAAADLGKLKTTFQALALGTLCLPLRDPDLAGWLQTPGEVLFYVAQVCLAIAVALTMWSGYEFSRDVWKQRASLRSTS